MQCKQLKSDGSKCKAKAMQNSGYCFTHNPATREAHKQATTKGGSVTKPQAELVDIGIDLKDPNNTLILLADTISRVRRVQADGSMDIKTANCIGFLTSKMLEAQRQITMEQRLTKLEELTTKGARV